MLPQFSSAQLMEDFLQQLLIDAGMDGVSPEVKDQMLTDLRARLEDRLLGTIILHLSEEDLVTFNKLSDDNASEEQVTKFIDEKIPDYAELAGQAMLQFKNDYLGI